MFLTFAVLFIQSTTASAEDAPVSVAGKSLTVIFMKGFDAVTSLDNPKLALQDKLKAIFSGNNVEFDLDNSMTRDDLAAAFQRADIFYLNAHAVKPYHVNILADTRLEERKELMQGIKVTPGGDNKDTSPAGNAVATAIYLRKQRMENQGKIPRLVIMNGCALTDRKDNVIMVNRISHAVGIPDGATDRAFISWDYSVFGTTQDPNFVSMLEYWTSPGADGKYPTLADAITATNWGGVKPPVIVGSSSLRYR